METLNKDMLVKIALELDLPRLLRFCESEKRINDKVCKNNDFWRNKLERDFPDYKTVDWKLSFRGIYNLLYFLKVICKLNESPSELYNDKELYLSYNQLKKIPKEIGKLSNLQTLYLSNNQLKILPKEIGTLSNLQNLFLRDNQLKEIPKEIGKLSNLEVLNLGSNQLEILPKEIGKLSNLQRLYLFDNKLKEIPKEILKNKKIVIYK